MCLNDLVPFRPQGFAMLPISAGDKLLPVPIAIENAIGYKPHPTTCTRWTRQGVKGVKLFTVMVGGRPRTTESAVIEFIKARTANSDSLASDA